MSSLARPVGLGLAARDDVGDVVGWARAARDAGLDSVWVHDSYFERDAITFVTAIALALELDGESAFRVALGAVNPNTRHPVVLAMTGSALDEILPGRIVMALGTGLPLRLKQDRLGLLVQIHREAGGHRADVHLAPFGNLEPSGLARKIRR